MDISIIISTYNRAQSLSHTLQSFQSMTVPDKVEGEILIVDNNSKDKTRQLVEDMSRRNSLNLNYLFESRQGKSFALNRGLENAKGEIIAFTDDDVIVDKGWLAAVVRATRRYESYDGFGGRIISLWESTPPQWLSLTGKHNALRGTGYLRDDGAEDKEYSETENRIPCGANMFFKRRAVEENGPFRLDLGPVGEKPGAAEDTEYCLRMLKSGKRFKYIGNALIYHKVEAQKLTQRHLTLWRYYAARSLVRSTGISDNVVTCSNIPRYLLRRLLETLPKWAMSRDSKSRFFHKMRFYWTLGEIVESYQLGRNYYHR